MTPRSPHSETRKPSRLLAWIAASMVLAFAGTVVSCGKTETRKKPPVEQTISVVLPPPPPPPPPPPAEPPPQEVKQEMVEETAPVEEEKQEDASTQADDPGPIGLPEGDGPGGYGPGKGNGGKGTGNAAGHAPRSRWGWYAGQVQTTIADAMRRNPKLHNATLTIRAAIWADATGRVTRAKLIGSSGDAGLDQTLQSSVLNGLQLREPPPEGMPMPIQLRLTARKPN